MIKNNTVYYAHADGLGNVIALTDSTSGAAAVERTYEPTVDMLSTCKHVCSMSRKMIQIRHVPADLHSKLKARAAMQGKSLSDYLLGEIRRVAEQPTIEELWERIKRRRSPKGPIDSVTLIREERDAR